MPLDNTNIVSTYLEKACLGKGGYPIPLKSTAIKVSIEGGIATVVTERKFRNDEKKSIEATLTIPVPVHATITSMKAKIDERELVAQAQAKVKARETYETAMDEGKTSLLHEELLRGVHMISVGQVGAGKEVVVTTSWSMPLQFVGNNAQLRIPSTVGEIYGRSPLHESDSLQSMAGVEHRATLEIQSKDGQVVMNSGEQLIDGKAEFLLDHPIDIAILDWKPGTTLKGLAADGRTVTMEVKPVVQNKNTLNANILLDISGSMGYTANGVMSTRGENGPNKWDIMMAGARDAAHYLTNDDIVRLVAYSSAPKNLGTAKGKEAFLRLLNAVPPPSGGTEIGRAIDEVLSSEMQDILLITDGKTYAGYEDRGLPIQRFIESGKRFTVVLIGEDSLEASVGHLAALTGGELFVCHGDYAKDTVIAAIGSMRSAYSKNAQISQSPEKIERAMGGMRVLVSWSKSRSKTSRPVDAIGALAASLAIPNMEEEAAAQWAASHGIVCHLTSLVLVDDVGEVQAEIPQHRKVSLSAPRTANIAGSGAVMFAAAAAAPAAMMAFSATTNSMSRLGVSRSIAASTSKGTGFAQDSNVFSSGLSFDEERARSVISPGAAKPEAYQLPYVDIFNGIFQPVDLGTLYSLKGKINWDNLAESLSKGDTTGLDWNVQQAIMVLASNNTQIADLATKLGVNATLAVLLLVAHSEASENKSAARFERKIIKQSKEPDVSKKVAEISVSMGLKP